MQTADVIADWFPLCSCTHAHLQTQMAWTDNKKKKENQPCWCPLKDKIALMEAQTLSLVSAEVVWQHHCQTTLIKCLNPACLSSNWFIQNMTRVKRPREHAHSRMYRVGVWSISSNSYIFEGIYRRERILCFLLVLNYRDMLHIMTHFGLWLD